MNTPLEDRLRAHYADRTERESLPGPDTDEALTRVLELARRNKRRSPENGSRRFPAWLAIAAALALLVGVAGVLTLTDDDSSKVSTRGEDTATTSDDQPSSTASPPSSTSSTASTTSSTAPAQPTTEVAVVVGVDGLLGWWDGRAWVNDEGAAPPVEDGAEYQIVRLDEPITTRTGQLTTKVCVEDGIPTVDVGIESPANVLEASPIAVTGVADPRPRPVQMLDPGDGGYQAAAVEVLQGLGVNDPQPPIVQAIRTDLDGDGVDEVLVTTERLSNPEALAAQPGDYSVTFLRRSINGAVETNVVAESVATDQYPGYIERLRVSAVADLNGDDRMEIVVDARYYEGSFTNVFEVASDGGSTKVLSAFCGL